MQTSSVPLNVFTGQADNAGKQPMIGIIRYTMSTYLCKLDRFHSSCHLPSTAACQTRLIKYSQHYSLLGKWSPIGCHKLPLIHRLGLSKESIESLKANKKIWNVQKQFGFTLAFALAISFVAMVTYTLARRVAAR